MAVSQYIREAVNATYVPVDTATLVEVGDFCALVTDKCVPALDFVWDTNLATTQTSFATAFLGHSFQYKPAAVAGVYGNSTENIIGNSTSGVYECDLDTATTIIIGDFVGMAKAAGNTLLSQEVMKVSTMAKAIGVVVHSEVSATRAQFRLLPSVVPFAR